MKGKKGLVISIALLVTGNLIGAGILGIPVTAGLAGVYPSLIVMVVCMLAMFFSAVVLAEETIETGDVVFNYPSLYHKYLGTIGKWIATLANMVILYGLLVAYLAGGTSIITRLINNNSFWIQKAIMIVFFLAITFLTIKGIELIKKCNTILIILLWGAFFVITYTGFKHIVASRFNNINLMLLPLSVPILVTSFHFHNIIPNIAHNAKWQKKIVYPAMFTGMLIGFLLNAVWLIVGTGVLPLYKGKNSILYSYIHNIPALNPMSNIIGTKIFLLFALLFGIIAIITSYFANGLGLMGFCRDFLYNYFNIKSEIVVILVTFIPPIIIALINPNIFLKALDVVGGIGIVILFGILPCIISLLKPNKTMCFKVITVMFLIIFLSVFLYKIAHMIGIINIDPTKYFNYINN